MGTAGGDEGRPPPPSDAEHAVPAPPDPSAVRFARDLAAAVRDGPLTPRETAAALRARADALEQTGRPAGCRVIEFEPGRRPTDEEHHVGLGSSDPVAIRLGEPDRPNAAYVLFDVDGLPDEADVTADIVIEPIEEGRPPATLEGWEARLLELVPSSRRQRVAIRPEHDFRDVAVGFEAGFLRRATVRLRATFEGHLLDADELTLEIADRRSLGTLYRRVIDRLLVTDGARQARRVGQPDPGAAYHPWFPVLQIGGDKAALYTDALVHDIVDKAHHLTDPSWLLRVGVYLELLTCLGIADAVRDDIGDLLDPDERRVYETSDRYAPIRAAVDVDAWRSVWRMRQISFPRLGVPRAGPVSATNLLTKRRATLAFLHAHHEDLKHAIRLAGPNMHNAQETWQRVFRDAERAVLRQTPAAFPELDYLAASMREFVLWNRRSVGEQSGLYDTACVQYRASMNTVAEWAKAQGLMDYTGDECIPASVSLFEAHMTGSERVAVLQRNDGYGPSLELTDLREPSAPTRDEIVALFSSAPVFGMFDAEQVVALTDRSRPILLGPSERLVKQGDAGASMFVVGDGDVEVVLRREDGRDVHIENMGSGAVIGEMSLLTGEPRSATVRGGLDGAVVYEIVEDVYFPLVRHHPEWIDLLAEEMEQRLDRRLAILGRHSSGDRLRDRIRTRILGGA